MDRRGSQLLWATLLVVGGLILLLLNLGVLETWEPVAQYVIAGALALGSIGFFAWALSSRSWQRIIPAWTLLAVAIMVLLGMGDAPNTRLVAATLLWGLAAAFAHIYLLLRRENWWAVIPSGFMLVLGIVVALSGVVQSLEMLASILFGGIGLVFFALYLVTGEGRHWWALLPGSILLLFAFFVLTGSRFGEHAIVRWWPLLVIAAGVLAAWRAWTRPARSEPSFERHHAPPMLTPASASTPPTKQPLGEYSQPAPGATIDVLPD
jgi:hypothetical protein